MGQSDPKDSQAGNSDSNSETALLSKDIFRYLLLFYLTLRPFDNLANRFRHIRR